MAVNLTVQDVIAPWDAAKEPDQTNPYDANGNMTHRLVNNAATIMSYDAENRLVQVSGATTAAFVYNGDGERVRSTVNGATTAFIGNILEWTGSTTTMKRYYYAGATRIAMRTGSTLSYILGDHLGNSNITTDANGVQTSETMYKPWGEVRYSSGTLPTKYTFTGQYSYASNSATDFGLLYYNARWVDPALGRFAQADTLIPSPSDPQSWDRFVYINNNPVNGTDSSGHCIDGLTTVPCLIALIAISGFAGGAAIHEFNVSGNSWWESKEDAAATFDSGMKGATIALIAADVAVKVAVTGNFALEEVKAIYHSNDATKAANVTQVDLYAFGNTTGPRSPRSGKDVFPNDFGNIGPEALPFPAGASTFGDPNMAPLSGPYHRLPAGTELPNGMSVVADGVDAIPYSTNPPTHHTIYPTVSMPYDDFSKAFTNLPWNYAGKK